MSIPVLGVNFGTHDSAAAIVVDGHVVAAAEEERFTRIKQTKQFPVSAIAFCMAEAGLTDRDMIDVALFVDPRLKWLLAVANTRHAFPWSLGSLKSDLGKALTRRIARTIFMGSAATLRSAHKGIDDSVSGSV